MVKIKINLVEKLYNWFYSKSETDNLLNGKANTSHTHIKNDITDLSTVSSSSDGLMSSSDKTKLDNIDLTGYYNKSEVDTKISNISSSIDPTNYYTKTEIDSNISNEIEAMKKVAHIQLRTPLVVHNGCFEVYITDYAGNPITGATVKGKVEWGSSSTSNVTLSDQGGGVYSKCAYLSNNKNIRVKNTVTFTHSNYNSTTCYFQIYLI